MIERPYFMSDESWYKTNEDGVLFLTDKAPADAVADYNKHRDEYVKRVSGKSVEETLDIVEDDDWLIFPVD